MSSTTDSGATMAGAANTNPSPAAGEALTAQAQEALSPAQMRKAAALLDLDKVEALLQRRREMVADAKAKYAAMQAEAAQQAAAIDGLNQQVTQFQAEVDSLRAEVETLRAAKAQLEAEAQQHAEEIEVIDQKTADLQAQFNEAEAERLKLQGELDAIRADLGELSGLADADDEQIQAFAEKLAAAGVADGNTAVIVAAIQRKNAALKDANAQLAAAQEQLAAMPAPAAVAESTLPAEDEGAAAVPQEVEGSTFAMTEDGTMVEVDERLQAITIEPEIAAEEAAPAAELAGERAETVALEPEITGEDAALTAPAAELADEDTTPAAPEPELSSAELEALKLQLDTAVADRDSAQAMIDERDSELVALRAQLAALTAPPPAKQVSDFKAAARSSAVNLGVEPRGVVEMQDLASAKHIGSTYEQRLYRAGVGTFWELAHLTDDDFELILRLTPMQSLAMSTDEARAAARQLAEETESVGAIWEGEVPDDFEPIPGIGKVFEQRLYDAGIRTYKDLANASAEQLADICKARKPIQPDYAGWIRQARKLMEIRNG